MPPFSLYGGSYLQVGNVLEDPVLPTVRGADFVKFIVAVGLLGFVLRKFWK